MDRDKSTWTTDHKVSQQGQRHLTVFNIPLKHPDLYLDQTTQPPHPTIQLQATYPPAQPS